MTAEIVLSLAEVKRIRSGATVLADSSDGKAVCLSTMSFLGDGRFRVTLTPAQLDLIEREPEGLVCGTGGSNPGWIVRVAS